MINDSVVLVFVENEAEKNSIFNTIEKIGQVCNFEEQKPFQIIKRLKAICNVYKVNVDENVLQYLIDQVLLRHYLQVYPMDILLHCHKIYETLYNIHPLFIDSYNSTNFIAYQHFINHLFQPN